MTFVTDAPEVIIGDDLEVDLMPADSGADTYDSPAPVIVNSTDNEEEEELDIEEFDDDDFDDEFDDDFEDEDEGEYDVVEEFEDDFTFVDPATKKPVTHSKDVDDGKKVDDAEGKDGDAEISPDDSVADVEGDDEDDAGKQKANEK